MAYMHTRSFADTVPAELTEEELLPWQRTGANAGVQPAEAATEVGQEDDLDCARGIVYAIPAALVAWAAIAACAVAWKFWPQIVAAL